MSLKILPPASNEIVLANLPPDTYRVQVRDAVGRVKYKQPHLVNEHDQIVLSTAGKPITMSRPPGRPGKPELKAASEDIHNTVRAKEEFVDVDELLGVIRTNPEGPSVLDHVMTGLAEEAASLGFERVNAERHGQDTSGISMKRVTALKAVGETWLRRKEQLSAAGVDLDSAAFAKLFKFIMDTFRESLIQAGSRPEMIETVFTGLAKRIDEDWRREATQRMTED